MKNLNQIRASGAIEAAKQTTKQEVNKLPAMIITDGLLATIAFSIEEGEEGSPSRPKLKAVMDAVARHLANPVFGLSVLVNCKNANELLTKLTQASSFELQAATNEALKFISYVKRFAVKGKEES